MSHIFTVDVEEYFQVSAFESRVSRDAWSSLPSRVERSLDELLELLADAGAKGTFFVLGWLAERQPSIVQRIAGAGHEVASHGWDHRRVNGQGRADFRASARRSRALLEDHAGAAVTGFRAPSFSITPGCEWALDVLLEEGYRYDSSLYPIRRSGYGYPGAARSPFWIRRPGGELLELPPPTVRLFGVTLPAAGGAYLRLFPYAWTRRALRDAERRGQPVVVYVHPWELDPAQPRLPVGVLTRVRHYGGLRTTAPKLRRMLAEYRFTSVARYLKSGTGMRAPGAVA